MRAIWRCTCERAMHGVFKRHSPAAEKSSYPRADRRRIQSAFTVSRKAQKSAELLLEWFSEPDNHALAVAFAQYFDCQSVQLFRGIPNGAEQ